jgi:hypothetical protein
MLGKQVIVLGNIPVIEICYPQVKQDIKEKRKVKNYRIETIFSNSYTALHREVDSENPYRLDQKIEKKQQAQICQEFSLHEKKSKKG